MGTRNFLIVIAVLVVMVTVASWIVLGTVKARRVTLYKQAVISILMGGGLVLAIVTQGVLSRSHAPAWERILD